MKLLFDQNLSRKLCSQLDDLFPDSEHVLKLGLVLEIHLWFLAPRVPNPTSSSLPLMT